MLTNWPKGMCIYECSDQRLKLLIMLSKVLAFTQRAAIFSNNQDHLIEQNQTNTKNHCNKNNRAFCHETETSVSLCLHSTIMQQKCENIYLL